jgi:histone deacetylase complex regulatory component SIN3
MYFLSIRVQLTAPSQPHPITTNLLPPNPSIQKPQSDLDFTFNADITGATTALISLSLGYPNPDHLLHTTMSSHAQHQHQHPATPASTAPTAPAPTAATAESARAFTTLIAETYTDNPGIFEVYSSIMKAYELGSLEIWQVLSMVRALFEDEPGLVAEFGRLSGFSVDAAVGRPIGAPVVG